MFRFYRNALVVIFIILLSCIAALSIKVVHSQRPIISDTHLRVIPAISNNKTEIVEVLIIYSGANNIATSVDLGDVQLVKYKDGTATCTQTATGIHCAGTVNEGIDGEGFWYALLDVRMNIPNLTGCSMYIAPLPLSTASDTLYNPVITVNATEGSCLYFPFIPRMDP